MDDYLVRKKVWICVFNKKASQNIKKSTHIILKFEKGQIGSNVSESIQILLNSLATVAKYLAPFK